MLLGLSRAKKRPIKAHRPKSKKGMVSGVLKVKSIFFVETRMVKIIQDK